ncbi:MAG TPA: monofunctional biosynthetic peptidoglycan transglycosylase [Thermoanaerobaculia bacterium]|nr:monofunctional biosynthetic peptidoglycan transglycosylase [Thermoanaerobaculia bacterium]
MVKKVFLALLAVVALWLVYELVTFPDVAALAKEPPKTTAFMELRKKQLRAKGKSDELEWKWVSYGRISPNLRRAVLVAEDNAFYEHEGVDVEAMKEAFERNWKRRRITHGGSTITQQLAKNLYLSPSRNPLRKVKEYFITRALEKHLSKKRILEIYLNVVELGERVYGAEAGARHYFGKSAAALSPREAALLAGALPNPRVMNPGSPNKRLRARQRMILSRMRRWGYVFEREVLTEKKRAPEPAVTETAPETAGETAPPTDTDLAPPETETTETASPDTVSTDTVGTDTVSTETVATDTVTTDTSGTQ